MSLCWDALDEGDLGRRPLAGGTMVDERPGFLLAERDPIGADVGIGRGDGRHVDLKDLDAVVLSALQQTRIGLNVGIVDDQQVRLFRDRRGQRLRAGVGAPVGVADVEGEAQRLRFLAPDRRPGFGEVETHRDRDEDDLLALQRVEILAAADLIEAGVVGARGPQSEHPAGQRREQREREQRLQFHEFILPVAVIPI
jgi:hypothetical protein